MPQKKTAIITNDAQGADEAHFLTGSNIIVDEGMTRKSVYSRPAEPKAEALCCYCITFRKFREQGIYTFKKFNLYFKNNTGYARLFFIRPSFVSR